MLAVKNIVYIGSAGVLSELPLRVLLQHGIRISAIAMLDSNIAQLQQKPVSIADIRVGQDEALASSASLLEIAEHYRIPVIALELPLQQAADKIAEFNPDLLLMSCFPRRLPAVIFNMPALGCFNLHPSLLPAYRGPSPVHWQCEHKVELSGVTVHQVNAEFDAGDIAIQKTIQTRDCINKLELAYKLALLGGEAFMALLSAIEQDQLELRPQAGEASYFGFPGQVL